MRCHEKKRYVTLEAAQSAAAWCNTYFNDGVTLSAYKCEHRDFICVPKSKWSKKQIRKNLDWHYHITHWDSVPAMALDKVVRGARLLRLEQLLDSIGGDG